MFPNGWPGLALLLRGATGILLVHDAAIALQLGPDLETIILQSVAFGAGTLLLLGLWTPLAGVLVPLVEVCFLVLGTARTEFHSAGSGGCRASWSRTRLYID